MRELRKILEAALVSREDLALATIVATSGSSYRRAGARLLVLSDGLTVGSLSGGCLEDEVAARGMLVLASGKAELFWMDTRRLHGCNGAIQIFIERISPRNRFWQYLRDCISARLPVQVRVDCHSRNPTGSQPGGDATSDDGFEELILPPIRLVLVGNDPGNPALVCFAQVLGWEAVALENTADLAPLAERRTALVIGHHHFGRDFAVLKKALELPFGYIGLLGSRRRKSDLLNAVTLDGCGVDGDSFERLHAPAGLDVGAEEPEEIALSIAAEIQAVMLRHTGDPLRDKTGPIHPRPCQVLAP